MHRIMIVEDNESTRFYLSSLVEQTGTSSVVASCRSAEEALEQSPAAQPDLVLLDISLPGMSGLDFISESRNRGFTSEFVMLSVHEDRNYLLSALTNGAIGYILKGAASFEIVRALQTAARGGVPLTPAVARCLLEEFSRVPAAGHASILTESESEILHKSSRGWTDSKLAAFLNVENHVLHEQIRSIYRKLRLINEPGSRRLSRSKRKP